MDERCGGSRGFEEKERSVLRGDARSLGAEDCPGDVGVSRDVVSVREWGFCEESESFLRRGRLLRWEEGFPRRGAPCGEEAPGGHSWPARFPPARPLPPDARNTRGSVHG